MVQSDTREEKKQKVLVWFIMINIKGNERKWPIFELFVVYIEIKINK